MLLAVVWQLNTDFPFVCSVQYCGVGSDCEHENRAVTDLANTHSMIKTAEWGRMLCVMNGEGLEEGNVMKHKIHHHKSTFQWCCSFWDGIWGRTQLQLITTVQLQKTVLV